MVKKQKKFILIIFVIITVICSDLVNVSANDNGSIYYLSNTSMSTKKDNGFSDAKKIDNNDPHFGWNLGRFYITGFTDISKDKDKVTVLKTPGDKLKLKFKLDQKIDELNGDKSLHISKDRNGYDKDFAVEKTNFGKGTLIVRYTDYKNYSHKPTIYTDYLSGVENGKADTTIELSEEGDYEVALDYEIKHDKLKVGPVKLYSTYTNYKIICKFSIRNGNCMIYPFDIKSKDELTNGSLAPNGFYIDLAKSRYLTINIKKEILNKESNGLIEDTRFNKIAKDEDSFTDEGIYTLTVNNSSTGEETKKIIYVGDNNILKASVVNNLSIKEVNSQLKSGAKITKDGEIVNNKNYTSNDVNNNVYDKHVFLIVFLVFVFIILVMIFLILKRKKIGLIHIKNHERNDD